MSNLFSQSLAQKKELINKYIYICNILDSQVQGRPAQCTKRRSIRASHQRHTGDPRCPASAQRQIHLHRQKRPGQPGEPCPPAGQRWAAGGQTTETNTAHTHTHTHMGPTSSETQSWLIYSVCLWGLASLCDGWRFIFEDGFLAQVSAAVRMNYTFEIFSSLWLLTSLVFFSVSVSDLGGSSKRTNPCHFRASGYCFHLNLFKRSLFDRSYSPTL